jgi:iron complex transport system substrate-binding protein
MADTGLEPLGRRTFLLGAVAGAATLGAAACGGGSGGAGAAPASSAGGTRMLRTATGGAVRIPASPRRVACTTHQTALPLLDVGYTPAGVGDVPNMDTFIAGPPLARYQALPKIGSWVEINLEQLATKNPDLIMGAGVPGWTDPKLKEFQKIAPTVVFTAQQTSDWTKVAIDVADAVGRRAQAEELRRRYLARAASIKSTYAGVLGKTKWSMVYEVSYGEGQWSLLYPDGWIGIVLRDAGVQFGQATAGKKDTGAAFSLERLNLLDDSDVIVGQAGADGKLVKMVQDLAGKPGWQNLKAVKAGHVYPMPNFYAVSYGSALSVLDTLEGILERL